MRQLTSLASTFLIALASCGSGGASSTSSVAVTLPPPLSAGSAAGAQRPAASSAQIAPNPGPLALTVEVSPAGLTVLTAGRALRADCVGMAGGVTFRRNAQGAVDLQALKRCARTLKTRHPQETAVVIYAERDLPYRDITALLEALRADAEGDLFPEFALGVRPAAATSARATASASAASPVKP